MGIGKGTMCDRRETEEWTGEGTEETGGETMREHDEGGSRRLKIKGCCYIGIKIVQVSLRLVVHHACVCACHMNQCVRCINCIRAVMTDMSMHLHVHPLLTG